MCWWYHMQQKYIVLLLIVMCKANTGPMCVCLGITLSCHPRDGLHNVLNNKRIQTLIICGWYFDKNQSGQSSACKDIFCSLLRNLVMNFKSSFWPHVFLYCICPFSIWCPFSMLKGTDYITFHYIVHHFKVNSNSHRF